MNNREEIKKEIEKILSSVLEINDFVIDESLKATDIEEWDSLAHINIISEIEKKFNIKFKLQEFYLINDVKSLIDFVEKKLCN